MTLLESLDTGVTGLLGQWNTYSSVLATLLVAIVGYKIVISSRDADVHPLLLARQTVPSTVRNRGESAVYRAHAAPHGMPLSTGLGVRDADAPKWSRGVDGDIRHVWRQAAASSASRGRLLTVHGSQKVVEHSADQVTRQINIIGRHLVDAGASTVAIYLPNSIELLVALFACSFYTSLTPVLVPYDASSDELASMLGAAAVDAIITAPGTFTLDAVVKALPSLRQMIWVVDAGNRHMDWDSAPDSSVKSDTWHDLVAKAPALVGSELPPLDPKSQPRDVVTFWRPKAGREAQVVRFSHANIVAGMAGQIAAIPTRERLGPADVFLPADSLTNIYTLVMTLVAVYSNAAVALNSVAGPAADLVLACQGVAPTVIVASPDALANVHADSMAKLDSALARLSHRMATRSLAERGAFPPSNLLSCCAAAGPVLGSVPGKLRLILVAHRAGTSDARLSPQMLCDLRVLTHARIVYALSAARVAGAVSQTALFDYRVDASSEGHFGAPTASVEILLRDKDNYKTTDDSVEGCIVARGPCVSGEEACLNIMGRIRPDLTLSCI